MKNRSFILLLALVFAVAGCGKEPQPAALSFAARTESIGDDWRTRTVLAEDYSSQKTFISWVEGDAVRINQYVYTASSVSGGTARFKKATPGDPSPDFKACYPASAASWSGSNMTITLPATQAEPASGLVSGFPMYAESKTGDLSFRNLCGLLKIRLKAASGSFKVSSIALKSDNLSLSGQCDIVSDGAGVWKASPTAGSGTPAGVQYTCSRTVSDASVSDFHIYLPPGDYSGFDITISTDAGTVRKLAKKIISVKRSQVASIEFLSLDPHYAGHDYVELGLPSKLKWATKNVGATSVTDRGTNDTWENSLSFNWGGAWRVPTKDDFVELCTQTYWQWTYSYNGSGTAGFIAYKTKSDSDKNKIGGVSGYDPASDVHIFLPATSDDHTQASYWTSTPDAGDSSNALRLYFTSGKRNYESLSKQINLFVRPVCP